MYLDALIDDFNGVAIKLDKSITEKNYRKKELTSQSTLNEIVQLHITIKLTDTANIIYNTRWYALPVQQQKMIVSIIRQGQIRNKLSGYIFSTSLETLMNVGKII